MLSGPKTNMKLSLNSVQGSTLQGYCDMALTHSLNHQISQKEEQDFTRKQV